MAVEKLTREEYNIIHRVEKGLYYDEDTKKLSKVIGDIDENGSVNAADIVAIKRIMLKIDPMPIKLAKLLDYKGAGRLNLRDLLIAEIEILLMR